MTLPTGNGCPTATGRTPRVGLLTAIWQRPALTRLILGYYACLRRRLRPFLDLRLMAVGSEGAASRRLAESCGFDYVEHPNMPLGAKWNAGLAGLKKHEVDAVIITGSDDLLNPALFERHAAALRCGVRFAGLMDMYFYDQPTGKAFLWTGYPEPRAGEPIGLGRMIHRDYIEYADWTLWEDGLRSGLDHSMVCRLKPLLEDPSLRHLHLGLRCHGNGLAPVDVKTSCNMWSFDQIAAGAARAVPVDGAALLGTHYPPELVEALAALAPGRGFIPPRHMTFPRAA